MRRLALPAAAVAIASMGAAGVAAAHESPTTSSPRKGATLATLPASVTIGFGSQIGRVQSVRVTRAGSSVNYVTRFGIDPRNVARVKANLRKVGPAGRYTVRWTIRAADGHVQSGTFSFRTTRKG